MQETVTDGAEPDPVEELVIECLRQAEQDGSAAIERICDAHPEHAARLRDELRWLGELGVVSAAPDDVPAQIDDFRPLRRLGQGGMGVVYLAEQVSVRRAVALKLMRAATLGEAAMARARLEARAVAKLRHPNIVRVFATGTSDSRHYIAMELVPGSGLDERISAARDGGEPLALREVLVWGRDLALALGCAHDAGLVHRDVKPSNVRIASDGRAKLLDFGLVRELEEPAMTMPGVFQGSPAYASPEQVEAEVGVGPPSDVYSLGVTLYECLALEVPFRGETQQQIFQQIVTGTVPRLRLRRGQAGDQLATVIEKATERDPSRRYRDGGEFAADLDNVLHFRPITARRASLTRRLALFARRNPAVAAALSVVAVAVVAVLIAVLASARRAAADRHAAGVGALADARVALDDYARASARFEPVERRAIELRAKMERAGLSLAERDELEQVDTEIQRLRRAGDDMFRRALAQLRSASEFGVPADAVRELRLRLYVERWRNSDRAGDATDARFHAELVASMDPGGPYHREILGPGTLTLASEPAGAAVRLYRFVDLSEWFPGAERRLIAAPWHMDAPSARAVEPRLVDPRSELLGDAEFPIGVPTSVPAGSYLAVFRRTGYEPLRHTLVVERSTPLAVTVELQRSPTTPDGFVYVSGSNCAPFWIQTTEVSVRDYLTFLDDVEAAPAPLGWQADRRGRYALPAGVPDDLPVVGVSHPGAAAYAEWFERRARANGSELRFRLPRPQEWRCACGQLDGRRFVFGDEFRFRWVGSAWASESVDIRPPRSFPRDYSPYGVWDLTGNAAEWALDWFHPEQNQRELLGGSFLYDDRLMFEIAYSAGIAGGQARPDSGFRLVGVR